MEAELLVQADKLVGGRDAVLVIDDTAIAKKGTHSVGVAAQYASALGKTANCQTLVSLTLARGEVPVMLGLRLFLPESWRATERGCSEQVCQQNIKSLGRNRSWLWQSWIVSPRLVPALAASWRMPVMG